VLLSICSVGGPLVVDAACHSLTVDCVDHRIAPHLSYHACALYRKTNLCATPARYFFSWSVPFVPIVRIITRVNPSIQYNFFLLSPPPSLPVFPFFFACFPRILSVFGPMPEPVILAGTDKYSAGFVFFVDRPFQFFTARPRAASPPC